MTCTVLKKENKPKQPNIIAKGSEARLRTDTVICFLFALIVDKALLTGPKLSFSYSGTVV